MLMLYGQLVKLKIIAYSDPDYSRATGDEYTALLNPQEFSENYNVEYNAAQAFGTTGSDLKFQRVDPQVLKLNFLFDATGVIKAPKSQFSFNNVDLFNKSDTSSVASQIESFKKVTTDYRGDIHSVPYVKLIWGEFLFKGRLQSLEITYTLFKTDGTPLRAKAAATFKRSITDNTREKAENNSSPDLTHMRVVRAGDTLPAMAKSIYGDASYYLQLAEENHCDQTKAGDQCLLPRTRRRHSTSWPPCVRSRTARTSANAGTTAPPPSC